MDWSFSYEFKKNYNFNISRVTSFVYKHQLKSIKQKINSLREDRTLQKNKLLLKKIDEKITNI